MLEKSENPCILCCAITGSVPKKSDNPAVPISISEQVESSHAAVEAGASIIHAHVRNPDGSASSCLLYTSPSPRDAHESRMPSSA